MLFYRIFLLLLLFLSNEKSMKKFLVIVLFLVPIIVSGCFSYEEIKIVKIKDVSYEELKNSKLKIAITATVNNPNYFNVKITNANMVLMLQDRVLGNVTQVEHVELIGQTEKDYTIHLSIELKDIMANAINLYRVFMNNPASLNLSGTVDVRSFLYSKTFQVDRLTFQ